MYGWLETGGFFAHTTPDDIVFRTTTAGQYITIGNSSSNGEVAALYVTSNQVGVKCLPYSDEYVASVKGRSIFYDGGVDFQHVRTSIDVNGEQLRFLDTRDGGSVVETGYADVFDSRLQIDSVVVDSVLTRKRVLEGVVVMSAGGVSIQENAVDPVVLGSDFVVDSLYKDVFFEGLVFVVRRRTYYVWAVYQDNVGTIRVRCVPYSKAAPAGELVFSGGETVDFEILDDWSPVAVAAKNELLYYRMSVDDFMFYDKVMKADASDGTLFNGQVEVKMFFKNPTHVLREELELGSLYLIQGRLESSVPDLVLKLVEFSDGYVAGNGQAGYVMRFEAADGMTDLEVAGLRGVLESTVLGVKKTVFVRPLSYVKAPSVVDKDVIVGYSIDSVSGRLSYQLVNTRLAELTSAYGGAGLLGYGIDTVRLGPRDVKSVAKHYKPGAEDTVVLDAYGVDDEIFTVMRQDIEYRFRGTPMKVMAVNRLGATLVEVVLRAGFVELPNVERYEGHYFHWIDSIAGRSYVMACARARYDVGTGLYTLSLEDVSGGGGNVLDDGGAFFYELGRVVYVNPIKYIDHVRVGTTAQNVYLPNTLTVGTHVSREVLTVNGDASVVGQLNIFNHDSDSQLRENRFEISYSDDHVLSLDGKLDLNTSNVRVKLPLEISSTVTATDFLQFSDARIKRDVAATSEFDDLERLMKVDVKTFKMYGVGHNRLSKGVIAQEVREAFPEAVSTIENALLPGPIHIAYVDHKGRRLRIHSYEGTAELKEGVRLRLTGMKSDKAFEVRVKRVEVVDKDYSDEVVHFVYLDDFEEKVGDAQFVRVMGVVDDLLLVNYEYLYMTSINAIKQLKRELDALRQPAAAHPSSSLDVVGS